MSNVDLSALFDEPVRSSSRAPPKEIRAALMTRQTAQRSELKLKSKPAKAKRTDDDDDDVASESYVEEDDELVVAGDEAAQKKRKSRDDEASEEEEEEEEGDDDEDEDDDDDDEEGDGDGDAEAATGEPASVSAREAKLAKKAALKAKKAQLRRTVFVGNVAVAARANHVKSVFKAYGDVEAVYFRSLAFKKVNMPRHINAKHGDLHPDRKSKNAYVVMATEAQVTAALAANGTVLQGLTLRVDRPEQPKKAPGRTVFVGNLPFTVEDEELRRHFAACGPIEGVRCVRDAQNNLGKGIAYVLFAQVNSMPAALALNGSDFHGRPLRVDKALPEARQQKGIFKKELTKHPQLGTKSSSYRVKKFVEKVKLSTKGVDKNKVHKELAGLNAAIAHGTGKPNKAKASEPATSNKPKHDKKKAKRV